MDDYQELAAKYGVDLSQHFSKKVDEEMVKWADMVLIMDGNNYKQLLLLEPTAGNKLIWMGAMGDSGDPEILDPYKKDPDVQEAIVKRLLNSSDNLVNYLANNR